MKILAVGEFKSRFSEVLQQVRQGKTVGVAFGRKGDLVAVLAPPQLVLEKGSVTLGTLKKRASFSARADFKISEEELLSL